MELPSASRLGQGVLSLPPSSTFAYNTTVRYGRAYTDISRYRNLKFGCVVLLLKAGQIV